MKIKIIKAGPWQINGNKVNFSLDQVLEIGKDVPDSIGEDMLRCEYAEPVSGKPKIETKEVEEKVVFDIYSTNDKDVLEKYARDTYGIELDKRQSPKALRKQIEKAKEKNNE